jgi:hypothetical protein
MRALLIRFAILLAILPSAAEAQTLINKPAVTRAARPGVARPATILAPAIRANATKIIAARQSYLDRSVMASPPTLTSAASSAIGSSNDGASATSISLLDTTKIRGAGPFALRNTGAAFLGVKGLWSQYGSTDTYFGGSGWGFAFTHTGTQFEIADNISDVADINQDYHWRMRMRVNGQWASAAPWTKADFGNPADGFRVLRFNFGSSATRLIEVFYSFQGAQPAWVNIQSGASVTLPALQTVEVLTRYWGDSFVETPYAFRSGYDITNTLPMTLADQLGVSQLAPAGRSAQGFTNPVDGQTFVTRIAANVGLLSARGHEIIQGSVNDNSASDAAITAAVAQALRNLRAGAPDACITFILPFSFDSNPTTQAKYDANKAGAMAAAATDPGIVIIETRDLPTINNAGALPNGKTQTSFDGVHPGKEWSAYVAPILADRIASAWRVKLATLAANDNGVERLPQAA